MTSLCVVSPVGRDAADDLVFGYLIQKSGQNRRITDFVPGNLHSPDFHRSFINPDMELAPDPAFRTTMLAGVPFAFSLDLDPSAVDQKMKRPTRAAIRDIDRQGC